MTAATLRGFPATLARLLASAKRLGVDTETSGPNWASDQLLLCQLLSLESGPVLVRNVHRKPSRLADLMADEAVVKVIHYAPFDPPPSSIRAQPDAAASASLGCQDQHGRGPD